MLDIFEIAEEEGFAVGFEEGKNIGFKEGKSLGMVKTAHDMLIDTLFERFNHAPNHILQQIRAIQDLNILKIVLRQILQCNNINEFEVVLNQIIT